MTKFKKGLALIVVSVFIFALAACGGSGDTPDSDAPDVPQGDVTDGLTGLYELPTDVETAV